MINGSAINAVAINDTAGASTPVEPEEPVVLDPLLSDKSATRYRCTLTGAANGLEDIVLPISSFTVRFRQGRPNYGEVVIPNALMHIGFVADRPSGEVVIEVGNGTEYAEYTRINYGTMGYAEGPRQSSISLSGYKQMATSPKTVAISGVSVLALQKDGLRRVTAQIENTARPGDTITWAGQQMTAGMIAIAVGRRTATMTVTEETT